MCVSCSTNNYSTNDSLQAKQPNLNQKTKQEIEIALSINDKN